MNPQIATVIQQIEDEREKQGNTHWNISKETGLFLNSLTRIMETKHVLEIGTSTGYSGLWFAEALQATGGTLTTIESHEQRYQEANKHFMQAKVTDTVTQIKGHAPECLQELSDTYTMLFFDATKMEHISYWKLLAPKLQKNGIIITDNIISHEQEFFEYKKYVQSQKNFQHSIIPIGSGLMLSVKTQE